MRGRTLFAGLFGGAFGLLAGVLVGGLVVWRTAGPSDWRQEQIVASHPDPSGAWVAQVLTIETGQLGESDVERAVGLRIESTSSDEFLLLQIPVDGGEAPTEPTWQATDVVSWSPGGLPAVMRIQVDITGDEQADQPR